MRNFRVLLALGGLLTLAPAAHAMIATAYLDCGPGCGNDYFTGNLGQDFTVVAPIFLQSMGVFNASGSGTTTGSIQVEIYDFTTSSVVVGPVTFTGASSLCSGAPYDVCQSSSAVLAPGNYQLDSVGFSADVTGDQSLPPPLRAHASGRSQHRLRAGGI
jgi:hypothetical protein